MQTNLPYDYSQYANHHYSCLTIGPANNTQFFIYAAMYSTNVYSLAATILNPCNDVNANIQLYLYTSNNSGNGVFSNTVLGPPLVLGTNAVGNTMNITFTRQFGVRMNTGDFILVTTGNVSGGIAGVTLEYSAAPSSNVTE